MIFREERNNISFRVNFKDEDNVLPDNITAQEYVFHPNIENNSGLEFNK